MPPVMNAPIGSGQVGGDLEKLLEAGKRPTDDGGEGLRRPVQLRAHLGDLQVGQPQGALHVAHKARLLAVGIQRGDLATIQGTTLFLAFAVVFMNLIVDILYAFLDPRVRY